MARPFCQPLICRPAAQNWTVVLVRRAAHPVMTRVIPTTIKKRTSVMFMSRRLSAGGPRAHLGGKGVEDGVGLADVEVRQHPGHNELGEREQIRDVDLAEDPRLHEARGEAVAERQQKVVDEEENRRRENETKPRPDELPKLVSLL